MKDSWKAAMQEAARLTRAGQIAEATALIGRALSKDSSTPEPGDASGSVIDGEFEVVQDARAPASPESSGWSSGTFANASGARDYRLFAPPPDSRAEAPRPLLLMLHGCTQDPDDFVASTRMQALALEQGVYLLCPAQSVAANSNRCWGWFEETNQSIDQGEPGIIAGLVRQILSTHPIDRRRVYVAGFSAGGAMAATLAALYPNLFAAAGVHSGVAHGAARDLMSALVVMHQGAPTVDASQGLGGEPVPMILFQGDADATVHSNNAARLIAQAGFVVGGPDERPAEQGRVPGGYAYSRWVYADPAGRRCAERWSIHGAGHGWSGGSALHAFTEPRGPDASREILRFFLEHPKDG